MTKNVFHMLCQCLLVLLNWEANAAITSVTASPNAVNVTIETASTATSVNWMVTLNESDALSRSGEFFIPNRDGNLSTVNSLLTVGAPTNVPPQPVIVGEIVVITSSMAQFWWDLNLRQVFYRRTFTDALGNSETAIITINLFSNNDGRNDNTGNPPVPGIPPVGPTTPVAPINPPPNSEGPISRSASGLSALRAPTRDLAINRLELRFPNKKTVAFVNHNAQLTAELQVSYQGIGLLRGFWQIADPAGPAGEIQFRNLSLFNRQLPANQLIEFSSPRLPTKLEGRYYLRFCAVSVGQLRLPETAGAECPTEVISTVVGYQVFPSQLRLPVIRSLTTSKKIVDRETRFLWSSVRKAAVYQLNILEFEESNFTPSVTEENIETTERFITGVLLNSKELSTTLSAHNLSLLKPGSSYVWKVMAYDAQGNLLAKSRPAEFTFDRSDTYLNN